MSQISTKFEVPALPSEPFEAVTTRVPSAENATENMPVSPASPRTNMRSCHHKSVLRPIAAHSPYLTQKARIWPGPYHVSRVRSTAARMIHSSVDHEITRKRLRCEPKQSPSPVCVYEGSHHFGEPGFFPTLKFTDLHRKPSPPT